jgi:hypothetical protein
MGSSGSVLRGEFSKKGIGLWRLSDELHLITPIPLTAQPSVMPLDGLCLLVALHGLTLQ